MNCIDEKSLICRLTVYIVVKLKRILVSVVVGFISTSILVCSVI